MKWSDESVDFVATKLFVNETGHKNWHDYHAAVKDKYIKRAKAALSIIPELPEVRRVLEAASNMIAAHEQKGSVVWTYSDITASLREAIAPFTNKGE